MIWAGMMLLLWNVLWLLVSGINTVLLKLADRRVVDVCL